MNTIEKIKELIHEYEDDEENYFDISFTIVKFIEKQDKETLFTLLVNNLTLEEISNLVFAIFNTPYDIFTQWYFDTLVYIINLVNNMGDKVGDKVGDKQHYQGKLLKSKRMAEDILKIYKQKFLPFIEAQK